MTAGSAMRDTDRGVDAPIAVLLVGGDEALGVGLEASLSAAASATVRVVPDEDAALDEVGSVDCVVRTGGVENEAPVAFLDAVRARTGDTPVLAYAAVEEPCVLLDALAAGYTDVVPAADAVDVLGDRVLRAVRAARTRRRANDQAAALRAERDRFAALFENIPEPTACYEIDEAEPVALDANPAFERVFGYEAETAATEASGPAPSLTVRVGYTNDTDGRGFFVADDGVGVPEDERDDVFEHGYSGDDATGFGLAIVKAVADAHEWNVAVEESASGGARFAFTDVDLVV